MPRTCILVNSAVEACLLSELTTRDISTIVVNLRIGNSTKKYIYCSVYLPHGESAPTDEFKNVVSYCDIQGIPVIAGCDANGRGSELMEYLSSTSLHILNVGNRPTFERFGREEVLDITRYNTVLQSYLVRAGKLASPG